MFFAAAPPPNAPSFIRTPPCCRDFNGHSPTVALCDRCCGLVEQELAAKRSAADDSVCTRVSTIDLGPGSSSDQNPRGNRSTLCTQAVTSSGAGIPENVGPDAGIVDTVVAGVSVMRTASPGADFARLSRRLSVSFQLSIICDVDGCRDARWAGWARSGLLRGSHVRQNSSADRLVMS